MSEAEHLTAARAARRVAWIVLIAGAVLMVVKFAVFAATGSAAVFSDAMESIVNIVAASMAIFATAYAARPADRDHPYGHGNIEFIAVGVEGTMIAVTGILVIFESARRLWFNIAPQRLDAGMIALGALNVALLGLVIYIRRRAAELQSPTLHADARHLLLDFATTTAIIIALLIVRLTGLAWIDPVAGIVMAIVIFIAGLRMIRHSLFGLLDEVDLAEDAMLRNLLDAAVASGEILSYHKLRHRHVGAFHWVDLHIQLPADMTVARAHVIATDIEHRIEHALGRADAMAHIEPPRRPRDADASSSENADASPSARS